ncbi:DNA-binding IclR family transcriptional regulator [Duganella sp. 1224]|uniref:helix-turn-helix domain-containing protein n=1 Tax=Duganella sp. 1224 TaxID=2587052 RepID=UPI0015C9EFB2|nr:helix-turn-helix domain-containing protein [Duganella sp. 1224]NYE60914.1 DNA-binding IclR family transcriptional regulator [Duganella sp. 1224]
MMDEQAMALLAGILEALWRAERERPDKPCSLARLSKQTQLPMSVLRRQLTLMADAGLVEVTLDEGGISGRVALRDAGRQLIAE